MEYISRSAGLTLPVSKKREPFWDWLKGILAFLVVWGHGMTYMPGDYLNNIVYVIIYSFHMPLFVFVSGYFYATKCEIPLKDIAIKQFKRLLVPQFAFCILGIIVWTFSGDLYDFLIFDENGRLSLKNIYHYLTSAWFVWCIFFCSVIVNFFVLYTKGQLKCVVILALSLLMVAFFYYDYLPGPFFLNEQVIRQLPFFVLGILLRKNIEKIINIIRENWTFAVVLFSIINIAFLSHYRLFNKYDWYKFLWMFNSSSLFYLLLLRWYRKWGNSIKIINLLLLKFGENSLGIYLIHIFLMMLLKPLSVGIDLGGYVYTMTGVFLLAFMVTLFCSYLSGFLRKFKVLKFLFLGE